MNKDGKENPQQDRTGDGITGDSGADFCINFYLMQSNTIKATTKIMIVGSQIKKRFRD